MIFRTNSPFTSTAFKQLLIVLICFMAVEANGQQYRNYSVIWRGKEVGFLKATSQAQPQGQFYATDSEMNINMLLTFKIQSNTTNLFSNAQLKEAQVQRFVNKKKKLAATTHFTDNHYELKKDKDDIVKFKSNIPATVTWLYFNEPVQKSEIFSEVFQTFLKFKEIATSVYETTLPDGDIMTYTYRSGILQRVEIESGYGEFVFKLKI
ncbi:DUF6134 family protein [Dyadobacter subterraneus]|uniref:GLPGLI family protein n=1 Tax=Dyadobacter subterraneus TaxID=2773304 RepID=A0ABR9WF98_9BACT|nr:DUF6134 family protein [Dyadobacter subterraneus]MBE9463011.1 hypothetical protein [Dyadobacter subterraneus]